MLIGSYPMSVSWKCIHARDRSALNYTVAADSFQSYQLRFHHSTAVYYTFIVKFWSQAFTEHARDIIYLAKIECLTLTVVYFCNLHSLQLTSVTFPHYDIENDYTRPQDRIVLCNLRINYIFVMPVYSGTR